MNIQASPSMSQYVLAGNCWQAGADPGAKVGPRWGKLQIHTPNYGILTNSYRANY